MSGNVCPQCGAPIELNAKACQYCGEKLSSDIPVAAAPTQAALQP